MEKMDSLGATDSSDPKDLYTRLTVNMQCPICKAFFDSEALVNVHSPCYYTKHNIAKPTSESQASGDKVYKCDKCSDSFANMNYLRRHITYHFDRMYACKLCDFKGFTQRDVVRHLLVHNEDKKFKCKLCNKEYRHQQMLQEHMRRHSGDKPFKCDWFGCGSSFVTHNGLKDHIKRHKKDKAAVCPLCGKSFVRNYELKTHVSRNHPNDAATVISNIVKTAGKSKPSSGSSQLSNDSVELSRESVELSTDSLDEKPKPTTVQLIITNPKLLNFKEKLETGSSDFDVTPASFKNTPLLRYSDDTAKRKLDVELYDNSKKLKLGEYGQYNDKVAAHKCGMCGMEFSKISSYIAHRSCFFRNTPFVDKPDALFECGFCETPLIKGFENLRAHYALHFDSDDEEVKTTLDIKTVPSVLSS
ncbi:Myoneurin [Halotydeus destructor]|nr:Myoneurin [Halotydeus destructor]